MRNHVIRTFANSNSIFRSLEDLLTKTYLYDLNLCNSSFRKSTIFTIPQKVRIKQLNSLKELTYEFSEYMQFLLKAAAGKLLVKGGTVVNEDRMFLADVYIEDGVIK